MAGCLQCWHKKCTENIDAITCVPAELNVSADAISPSGYIFGGSGGIIMGSTGAVGGSFTAGVVTPPQSPNSSRRFSRSQSVLNLPTYPSNANFHVSAAVTSKNYNIIGNSDYSNNNNINERTVSRTSLDPPDYMANTINTLFLDLLVSAVYTLTTLQHT